LQKKKGVVLKWDAIQWEETTSSRGMLDEVRCSKTLPSIYPSELNMCGCLSISSLLDEWLLISILEFLYVTLYVQLEKYKKLTNISLEPINRWFCLS
jgi:hypothetical protein